MKKLQAILVTGCGGDIGTGVGRVLKDLAIADRLIGADMSSDNAGSFIFDVCEIMLPAESAGYEKTLEALAQKYGIEIIVPTAEQEIRVLHAKGLEVVSGVPILLPNSTSLAASLDKWETNQLLEHLRLPHPWTSIVGESEPRELPCIIKSRYGRGSKGVMTVSDAELVAYLKVHRPEDIWQEYLYPDNEEYTCGLFGSADGSVRSITFRRRLAGGLTGSGEVVEDQTITDVLQKLAQGLDLRGSINVQLRLTKNGPMIFEINPRFSSTVVFRHKLGFKDVLWSIQEALGKALAPYISPKPGTKFYRGYTEYIAE